MNDKARSPSILLTVPASVADELLEDYFTNKNDIATFEDFEIVQFNNVDLKVVIFTPLLDDTSFYAGMRKSLQGELDKRFK